jgi:hypothetical protein
MAQKHYGAVPASLPMNPRVLRLPEQSRQFATCMEGRAERDWLLSFYLAVLIAIDA